MDGLLKTLYEELASLLAELTNYDATSEEYKRVRDSAGILADRIIELEKLKNAKAIEELKQEGELAKSDNALEVERIKQEYPVRRIAVDLIKTLVPVAVQGVLFVWGGTQMQKFEETGRYTSAFSRLIQGRFPRP